MSEDEVVLDEFKGFLKENEDFVAKVNDNITEANPDYTQQTIEEHIKSLMRVKGFKYYRIECKINTKESEPDYEITFGIKKDDN